MGDAHLAVVGAAVVIVVLGAFYGLIVWLGRARRNRILEETFFPENTTFAELEGHPPGSRLVMCHALAACNGPPCPIHFRSDHYMRKWPQYWRDDAGFMERICPHGVGYPDPDCRNGAEPRYGTCGHDSCMAPTQRAFHRMVHG